MFNLFKKPNKPLAFTKRFYNALKEHINGLELVKMSPLDITTKFKDQERQHFLDNAFIEYNADSKGKEASFSHYLKAAIDLYLPEEALDVNRVVPVIKDSQYLDELKKVFEQGDIELVHRKLNDSLYIFYAQDLDSSISFLNKDEVKSLGLTIDELHVKALENLPEILPDIQRHGDDGLFMFTAGGTYESSLILTDFIWTSEIIPVQGEPVIGLPSRDLLVVTGSEDHENLEKLKSLVADVHRTGDHIITDKLFIWKNGSLVDYQD